MSTRRRLSCPLISHNRLEAPRLLVRAFVDMVGCSDRWLPSMLSRSWEDDIVVLLVEALLDEGPRLDSDGPALEPRRPPLVVLNGLGAMRAASSAADLSSDGMTIIGNSPWLPLLL